MLSGDTVPQSQEEVQAAAAARKEARRIAHEARQAADIAAKAERKAARAAATGNTVEHVFRPQQQPLPVFQVVLPQEDAHAAAEARRIAHENRVAADMAAKAQRKAAQAAVAFTGGAVVMYSPQEEAQAAARARKEERRIAHEARQAADMAAKAERKAARAASNSSLGVGERKMSEFMQGKAMASQAYVNDASISLAQSADTDNLSLHYSDPSLEVIRGQAQEEQRQLAYMRAEERRRMHEASLALSAQHRERKAAEAEERRLQAEAARVAKQQKKEENM